MSKNLNEDGTPLNIETEHVMQHNVYLKKMNFKEENITYCGHYHDYDHDTLIAAGKVRVKFSAIPEMGIAEETKEYSAVSTFVTRSFREHEITSLAPDTVVCCIHGIREKDGEIIVPVIMEEHHHNPDFKFHSWGEFKKTYGNVAGRVAFTADIEKKQELFNRAVKEGTMKEGSGDDLI